jgi:hypothetical protein
VYPVTLEAREAKRRSILDQLMAEARVRAEESGRSINCKDRRKWVWYGASALPWWRRAMPLRVPRSGTSSSRRVGRDMKVHVYQDEVGEISLATQS